MKKFLIIISVVMFFYTITAADATYVYENKDGEYSTDVDKFIPQSGVKIKTSKLANMMENGTRNAMDGTQSQTRASMQVQRRNPSNQSNQVRKRSYKWF